MSMNNSIIIAAGLIIAALLLIIGYFLYNNSKKMPPPAPIIIQEKEEPKQPIINYVETIPIGYPSYGYGLGSFGIPGRRWARPWGAPRVPFFGGRGGYGPWHAGFRGGWRGGRGRGGP